MNQSPGSENRSVVVALEHHFVRVGDRVYTSLCFGEDYWREYQSVFDTIYVLARLGRSDVIPENHFRADREGVVFIGVPDYRGPTGLVKHLPGVLRSAYRAARMPGPFIIRSGNIGTFLWLWLMLFRKPYAREVQGEIKRAVIGYGNGKASAHVMASVLDSLCRVQLRGAYCGSYVNEVCREYYPTGHSDREFVFSSVRLNPEAVSSPRSKSCFASERRFLSVGRLEREKGHQILIEAAALLKQRCPTGWNLKIVGPGRQFEALTKQVRQLELEKHVQIVGPIKYGPELFRRYDEAHVKILPSLSEGMPRALIEAMGRGLPALASDIGGVKELLSESQRVPPGDADALCRAMMDRIENVDALVVESELNFTTAINNYSPDRMDRLKRAFWHSVLAGPDNASHCTA